MSVLPNVALGTAPDMWPLTSFERESTVAIIAAGDVAVRRITDAMKHAGMSIRIAFAGLTDLPFEALAATPDAVIVETDIDGFDSRAAVRRARAGVPAAGIVVVCRSATERQLPQYLEDGADGIVLADELDATLATAVRGARAHQLSLPGSLRHLIAPPALTHREKEILWLVAEGLTNGEIAARLYLAESTVKTHLSSAFRRLGVTSRRQAAALVLSSDGVLRRQLAPAAALRSEAIGTAPSERQL